MRSDVINWDESLEGSSAAKLLLPWLEEIPQVVSLEVTGVSLGPSGAKWLAD